MLLGLFGFRPEGDDQIENHLDDEDEADAGAHEEERSFDVGIAGKVHHIPPKRTGTRARTMPPAMTEPIWPDTLAPTACMMMKVFGSSAVAIFWMTRALIGKAEMPAAPTIGLILC